MLQLRKHLLQLLRAVSHPVPTTVALSSSLHCRVFLNTSASASPTAFSIQDYLVAACGLTSGQAIQASKKLSHLKSVAKPDAVLALLSGAGLSRPDIAAVVVSDPLLLISRASSIGPRLASLRDRFGLSAPQIGRFLQDASLALRSCDIAPKLEFWIPFFGSFDKLLHALKGNGCLLKPDLERVVKPNIELLQQCGISVCGIAKLVKCCPWLLMFNPERVKEFVLRAEQLGVPRSSGSFQHAVNIVCCFSQDKIAAKMEFLRTTLDCSTEKIRAAVCRQPRVLTLSEETLLGKIEFLRNTLGCSHKRIGVAVCKMPVILRLSKEKLGRQIEFMVIEVGLEPEYIVERPWLLAMSLEKRLMPRHYVVKILQAKGLMREAVGFLTLVSYGEKYFIENYIDRHKDAVPGLADSYASICAGKLPVEVQLR